MNSTNSTVHQCKTTVHASQHYRLDSTTIIAGVRMSLSTFQIQVQTFLYCPKNRGK